jgi:hypothetical protein
MLMEHILAGNNTRRGVQAWSGDQGPPQSVDELDRLPLQPRLQMMRYGKWIEEDLVIATGQVEGAVRHLVGERFDCAGMRWRQDKAEALLHLRCIELNHDWQKFASWHQRKTQSRLLQRKRHKILTNQPLILAEAA